MKKKIFATLLVLVMLCMPMFFLTGCGSSDAGSGVKLESSKTEVTVAVGDSITSVDWGLKFNYELKKWNSKDGEYQYTKEDGTFSKEATWYFSSDLTDINKILAAGVTHSGFKSSEAGHTGTVTFSFGGKSVKIQYTVGTTGGQNGNGGSGGNGYEPVQPTE